MFLVVFSFSISVWAVYITEGTIREENKVLACHNEAVHLKCSDSDSVLVIYSAIFATDGSIVTSQCRYDAQVVNNTCSDDVRLEVNSKCSGVKSCNFLVSDLVPRNCYGEGVLSLVYDCASATHITKFCNVNITGSTSEGFIHNPGYPNYYPDLNKCTWTIRANQGQHILLSLLDMSMQRSPRTVIDCQDYLIIYDGRVKLMHACGQDTHYLHTFESTSNYVRIVFMSQDVWPSRGVLFYYRVLGCPTLVAPEHGYLVFRNVSIAHYMCCARHVFVDTYKRNRLIYCQDGNHWNETVSQCKNVRILRQWKNITGVEIEDEQEKDSRPDLRVAVPEVSYVFDVMVPSIIMVALIICNVFIVCVILKMRRKKSHSLVDGPDIKSDLEPQPSTSKQNGLDKEEMMTNV